MSLQHFPPSDEAADGVSREVPAELLATLASPPMLTSVHDLVDRVRAAAGDSPDFGDVSLGPDQDRLTVYWHGVPPTAVQAVVDQPGDAGVRVVVEQVRHRPADVRAEADRLFRLPVVTSVGISPRDGVDVGIDPEVVEAAGSVAAAAAAHGVTSWLPLTLRASRIVPATATARPGGIVPSPEAPPPA